MVILPCGTKKNYIRLMVLLPCGTKKTVPRLIVTLPCGTKKTVSEVVGHPTLFKTIAKHNANSSEVLAAGQISIFPLLRMHANRSIIRTQGLAMPHYANQSWATDRICPIIRAPGLYPKYLM